MKKRYTVRYCHLKNIPNFKIGEIVPEGALIGIMGNTGKSDGIHLHIDCVEGFRAKPWRLSHMESGLVPPSFSQLVYFIDDDLFKDKCKITTHIYDPAYLAKYGKNHPAFDVISRSFNIYNNRSFPLMVLSTGYGNGYGNYVHMGFEV